MTPLFRKVDCLSIPVPDLDAALAFYSGHLGHELIWRSSNAAGLKLPDSNAELVLHAEGRPIETDLAVESVPRALERFTAAGGNVLAGPFDIQIGLCAVVADPWGNVLVLLDVSKGLLRVDENKRVIDEPDTTAITVSPITESFAAEIGNIDLARPLSAEDNEAVKQAFWTYSVLVFPEQKLEADQHLEFAKLFGPLEVSIGVYGDGPMRTRAEIADVSNLNRKNEIWGKESRLRMFQLANRLWHTDSSFKHLPALCSLLYARSIPPIGGHTEFADQRAAYDALPEATKLRLDGMVAEHSIAYSRAQLGFAKFTEAERKNLPPVPQMLVRTIPQSGRKSLYLASHAGRIRGMGEAEGKALIDELIAHTTQRQFVYTHRWRVGDLVMWDNRCTMHRGKEFDDLRYERDMQRATVSDIANTCEQAGVPISDGV